MVGVSYFGLFDIPYIKYLFAIIILEHFTYSINENLFGLGRVTLANILFFIRSAFWVCEDIWKVVVLWGNRRAGTGKTGTGRYRFDQAQGYYCIDVLKTEDSWYVPEHCLKSVNEGPIIRELLSLMRISFCLPNAPELPTQLTERAQRLLLALNAAKGIV